MVGVVESTTTEEPMDASLLESTKVEPLKETVLVVQHNWQEVANAERDETFFVSYRPPGEKSKFLDVKLNKKEKNFRSAAVECDKLPYRALKVRFPHLDGLSKTFVAPFAEYDEVHKGAVNAMDANRSGNLVVSTDPNIGLVVWNSTSGEILRQLEGHVLDVNCCRFFPSGLVVLSGGIDMSVRVWSVDRGHCARVLIGHTAPVLDVEFIGSGAEVLSAARDGTIRRWNCGSGVCVSSLILPRGSATSIQLTADESLLIGASDQRAVYIWDTNSKQPVCDVNVLESCTSVSSAGNYAYVGGNSGTISVIDLRQRSLVSSLKVNRGRVQKVRAVGSGVLASFADGGVCFYSDPTRSAQSSLEFTGADCDPTYDFTISGKYLFTGCRDKVVRKYGVDSFLSF